MKKIILLVLYIAILHSNICSQNYKPYYSLINKAENCIAESDFHKATCLYDSAFNMGLIPFGKDLHNAIVCNIFIDSLSKTVKYSENLFQLGIPLSYFNKDIFQKIRLSPYWTFIKKSFKKITPITNINLRQELEKKFKLDQALDDPKREKYFYYNIKWLKDLILNNNFPFENNVGALVGEVYITNIKIELLLLHWSELDKEDTVRIVPHLIKLVKEGKLHPTSLAILHYNEISKLYSKMNNFAYLIIGEQVLSPEFDLEELSQINKSRAEIGLNNFQDYQKITKFSLSEKSFIFNTNRILQLNKGLTDIFIRLGYKKLGV